MPIIATCGHPLDAAEMLDLSAEVTLKHQDRAGAPTLSHASACPPCRLR